MSKMDTTTQDLFLRLGATAQSRRARAEAMFRRLRFNKDDQIAEALERTPRLIGAAELDGTPSTNIQLYKAGKKLP